MSDMAGSVGSHLCWDRQVLIMAERTLSGVAHSGKLEEMDKELSKVIEDFDHAMNVEALHLAKETGKHSLFSQSGNTLFSVVSCRARAFTWPA